MGTIGCFDGCGASEDEHCWNNSDLAACVECGATPCPVMSYHVDCSGAMCAPCVAAFEAVSSAALNMVLDAVLGVRSPT